MSNKNYLVQVQRSENEIGLALFYMWILHIIKFPIVSISMVAIIGHNQCRDNQLIIVFFSISRVSLMVIGSFGFDARKSMW